MNSESILLLTKDACCKAYLPCYGNTYWKGKTPNLDELVAKGTKFNRFYTAAPSSNMAYLSMFTMMFPYQHEIRDYRPLPKDFSGETLFDYAKSQGFENHIMWDSDWGGTDVLYARCYGEDTTFHNVKEMRQRVGWKFPYGCHQFDEQKASAAMARVRSELESMSSSGKKIFLWCHLPHVLNGGTGYGAEIDLYDRYIGLFREFFNDDNIFLSADHGNMNGLKNKLCYGFDVYEPAVNIPLIAPRISGVQECDENISNIDYKSLIFKRQIPHREIIFSDSAYYAQPNRKLAVIYRNYRYLYNKATDSEELYDIEWDPAENYNLIIDTFYDVDRKTTAPACDYYFYPHWEQLEEIREKLRAEKNRIWREETEKMKRINAVKGWLNNHPRVKKVIMPIADKFIH